MAFFFLNKIETSMTKIYLEKELKQFGQLKFIGNIKEDIRNNGFNSTIAEFKSLNDENGFLDFCKSKKILPKKRVDEQYIPQQQKQVQSEVPHQSTTKASMIANPSFHFYKDEAYGKGIENFALTENFKESFEINGAQAFNLTTIYPGLLVGSGYNHPKLKEKADDFQLGFFFDHTTGLPIISGSSIKGVLKSVCEKKEFMQDIYKKTIELSIFEDNKTIFYDAFIFETKNENNKIFGSDYITSHFSNEEDGMFKEPNPIKFLKVLPNVTFKFQFKAPQEYVDLFKAIILDFGLGAKTNVGYGKFIEVA
ncbi:MAG: type III-B CRISPR module RAMP protein Cmr6 [Campylobacteraceae bacterium]|nr:type III-B CRISPR module RAMP protein Cmr6 [Campylobacteraceae bacterium]